jgi:hypothetical protein
MARWWELAIPGASTVAAGLAGAWFQSRSSIRLLGHRHAAEKDREHAQRQHEDERRWVSERKALYAEVLAVYEEWIVDVRAWDDPVPWLDRELAHQEYLAARKFDYRQAFDRLRGPLAELTLLASDKVRESSDALLAQLIAIEAFRSDGRQSEHRHMVQEAERRRSRLIAAMRNDLGLAWEERQVRDPTSSSSDT